MGMFLFHDVLPIAQHREGVRAIIALYGMSGAEHTYDSKQGGFASMVQSG